METISVKFDEDFAIEIEKIMKKHHYSTKTEFIREAVREKLSDLQRKETLLAIDQLHGFSRRKTTDKQLHVAREKAFEELARKIKLNLRA